MSCVLGLALQGFDKNWPVSCMRGEFCSKARDSKQRLPGVSSFPLSLLCSPGSLGGVSTASENWEAMKMMGST